MPNFNEILKNGQKAVSTSDPKKEWKDCITNIMFEIHRLNKMYGDEMSHHLMVEQKKCNDCGTTTFILAVREWDDHKRVLKFHKANWKAAGEGKYFCEDCKKGK